MAELKVRRLQTGDLFRLARIIKGCTSQARESLLTAAMKVRESAAEDESMAEDDSLLEGVDFEPNYDGVSTRPDSSMMELGFALFEAAVDQEREIKELFAGLINMKANEFDQTPVDTIVVILEKVVEQDDLPAFFSRAMGLVGKVGVSLT